MGVPNEPPAVSPSRPSSAFSLRLFGLTRYRFPTALAA